MLKPLRRKPKLLLKNLGRGPFSNMAQSRKDIWRPIDHLLRFTIADEENPEVLRQCQPAGIEFLDDVMEAFRTYEIKAERKVQMVRLTAFTDYLANIYRLAIEKNAKLEEIDIHLVELLQKFYMTFDMTPYFDSLRIGPPFTDEEIKGAKELAALKVSSALGISKASLYNYQRLVRDGKKGRPEFLTEPIEIFDPVSVVIGIIAHLERIYSVKIETQEIKYVRRNVSKPSVIQKGENTKNNRTGKQPKIV